MIKALGFRIGSSLCFKKLSYYHYGKKKDQALFKTEISHESHTKFIQDHTVGMLQILLKEIKYVRKDKYNKLYAGNCYIFFFQY